jgi:hypothetical protein
MVVVVVVGGHTNVGKSLLMLVAVELYFLEVRAISLLDTALPLWCKCAPVGRKGVLDKRSIKLLHW